MALNKSALETELKDLFESFPPSTLESFNGIAAAYHTYAGGATFGLSVPTLTSAQETAFAATLLSGQGALPSFVLAIQNGITVYWTGVPVAGATGAGTTAPPTLNIIAPLTAALTAILVGGLSSAQAAADIATQMDLVTKTVIAPLTLPPAGPVPTPIS